LGSCEEIYGASPHSDYGMITLLLTNGVPGLQVLIFSLVLLFVLELLISAEKGNGVELLTYIP